MSKIEEWGQKRPVQLAVISLVAGAVLGGLVSAYPADNYGYQRGRDAGVIATEEKWNQKVVQTVEERVKEQLPVAYQKEFEFSKAEIAKRDALNVDIIGFECYNSLCGRTVSYTHLTLPTNREV